MNQADKTFVLSVTSTAAKVHSIAFDHGFWEQGIVNRNKPEMIALMHSELSEALEGLRAGDPKDQHCPEFSSVEIEMADIVIRVMDFSHAFGYRLAEAILAKMEFNQSRPHKHGKTF